MPRKAKLSTDGGASLEVNPFAGLAMQGLPGQPTTAEQKPAGGNRDIASLEAEQTPADVPTKPPVKRHRLELKRVKSGRGGKTVIVISGFPSRDPNQLNPLAKELKNACATGGAVKDGSIEIQGDHRELLCKMLESKGYRPVLAGG